MKDEKELTGQRLKRLFDYQRFEKNGKLEKLIRETEDRCAVELSDEELSLVSAASGLETVSGDPENRRSPF